MASILIHTADESVTLTAQAVKRLLERGDGDAALLYLALLRHHGNVPGFPAFSFGFLFYTNFSTTARGPAASCKLFRFLTIFVERLPRL